MLGARHQCKFPLPIRQHSPSASHRYPLRAHRIQLQYSHRLHHTAGYHGCKRNFYFQTSTNNSSSKRSKIVISHQIFCDIIIICYAHICRRYTDNAWIKTANIKSTQQILHVRSHGVSGRVDVFVLNFVGGCQQFISNSIRYGQRWCVSESMAHHLLDNTVPHLVDYAIDAEFPQQRRLHRQGKAEKRSHR